MPGPAVKKTPRRPQSAALAAFSLSSVHKGAGTVPAARPAAYARGGPSSPASPSVPSASSSSSRPLASPLLSTPFRT